MAAQPVRPAHQRHVDQPVSSVTDPFDDPEAQEWLAHVRDNVVPMIDSSAYTMSVVPTEENVDIKFSVELGLTIMLDKPLILWVPEGQRLPPKLARIADGVIRYANTDDATMAASLAEGLARLKKKGVIP